MSEYLILIECEACGYEEFFEIDNLPGGREHCPYCAECGALLPLPNNNGLEPTPEPGQLEFIKVSCPKCGSYSATVSLQPDPDDEDNLCEYKCDDCGNYFVAQAPPEAAPAASEAG